MIVRGTPLVWTGSGYVGQECEERVVAKISRSKPRYAGALKWLEGEASSIVWGLQWSEHTDRSHLFRARTGLWSWALEMTTDWGSSAGL